MKSWTIEEMLDEGPCREYSRDRLVELWGGRERLTLLEICELDIPDIDKVWCGCLAPPPGWVDGIVERAVRNNALHCGIPTVEAWAERWLDGTDRSEESAHAAASHASLSWAAWAAITTYIMSATMVDLIWITVTWAASATSFNETEERRRQVEELIKLLETNNSKRYGEDLT